MDNSKLENYIKIIGLGSASGLLYIENSLFIVSDNSTFLYKYSLQEKDLTKIPLLANAEENIPKKDKYDFESITLKGTKLHLLGSGSTSNREKRITYDLTTAAVTEKDLSKLYQNLKQYASISDEELNIEGTLFYNEKWYLFQRGNGLNSRNGIFIINSLKTPSKIEFVKAPLPKINQIETSFTDAILVENKIYFLATAENTTSTYDDGEIFGTIIGRMNSETFEIECTQKISDTHKFEGVTLYKKSDSQIQFLICEDNDTEVLETNIYKLTLNNE